MLFHRTNTNTAFLNSYVETEGFCPKCQQDTLCISDDSVMCTSCDYVGAIKQNDDLSAITGTLYGKIHLRYFEQREGCHEVIRLNLTIPKGEYDEIKQIIDKAMSDLIDGHPEFEVGSLPYYIQAGTGDMILRFKQQAFDKYDRPVYLPIFSDDNCLSATDAAENLTLGDRITAAYRLHPSIYQGNKAAISLLFYKIKMLPANSVFNPTFLRKF